MTYFRNTVAVKCGINAAIVAEIIWELQKTEFDFSKFNKGLHSKSIVHIRR